MTTTNVPGVTDVEAERGHAVAMLKPYIDYRAQEKEAKGGKDLAGKLPRQYLADHPGEELEDGERGIRAWTQASKGQLTLQVAKLASENPDLVLAAARAGLLRLNPKAWEALEGQDADLEMRLNPLISQGPGSTSFKVEER